MDIVSDTYQNLSIKGTTREARGVGGTINFSEDDDMPEASKMKDFFQSSVNKTKLIEIIQKHAVNPLFWEWSGEVTISFGKWIRSRSEGVRDIMVRQDALHEEADNRILCSR